MKKRISKIIQQLVLDQGWLALLEFVEFEGMKCVVCGRNLLNENIIAITDLVMTDQGYAHEYCIRSRN